MCVFYIYKRSVLKKEKRRWPEIEEDTTDEDAEDDRKIKAFFSLSITTGRNRQKAFRYQKVTLQIEVKIYDLWHSCTPPHHCPKLRGYSVRRTPPHSTANLHPHTKGYAVLDLGADRPDLAFKHFPNVNRDHIDNLRACQQLESILYRSC